MNKIIFLTFLLSFSFNLNAQTWQNLNAEEREFCKYDFNFFKKNALKKSKSYISDSLISIHYKGAMYILLKKLDSIYVYQYLTVSKLDEKKVSNKVLVKNKFAMVHRGEIDSFLITSSIFRTLFDLKSHSVLNNKNIKVIDNDKRTNIDNLYLQSFFKLRQISSIKLDIFELRNPLLVIEGWHLKRLLLQMYLNFNHWSKVTHMIREMGSGYFFLNSRLNKNLLYHYDGKDAFTQMNTRQVFLYTLPIQFVSEKYSKPLNNYPLIPDLPEGFMLQDR